MVPHLTVTFLREKIEEYIFRNGADTFVTIACRIFAVDSESDLKFAISILQGELLLQEHGK